ncbi:hypothetical protein AVEN_125877-1 [Araneus ventricosus]|uniref:Uncharacterized protein n=1 Tax=Araneus ventricosus TaxID=182803 RepID=A0A4Y2F457_ARAVE|nr:hypothetical protein AVEN_125877-1 [Araneus ventricosus]
MWVLWSSLGFVTFVLKRHKGYFGTDLVSLNRCQMTKTSPGLTRPLQASAPHQRDDVWPLTYDLARNRPKAQRIFNGIVFRTWNPPVPTPYH